MTLNSKTLTKIQQQFLAARDVSVPITVIKTVDPAACVSALSEVVVDEENRRAPVVQWDVVRGFQTVNNEGRALATALGGPACKNPVTALEKCAAAATESSVVFFLNHQEFYRDPVFVQALWNLREPFKTNHRTLAVVQCGGDVPVTIQQDVHIMNDPLPGPADLERVLREQLRTAKLPDTDADMIQRGVAAVSGLSLFAAEQAIALSLTRAGLNLDTLRERHRQMIESTKGLHVWRGGETFDDLGGLGNFKAFAQRLKYQFKSVIWIDEIEKAFGGLRGDLTGITQDYLGVLLSFMTDLKVPGILLMGHPGTGKSALAKALGNTRDVPTMRMDLGGMHGSLVGESQHALRHALDIGTTVSQGQPLLVATCNSVAILPPEFVNRFKWRFFVDLPDDAEKKVIWPIQLRKHNLDLKLKRPDDTDWNGREIEQCCETAVQLGCDLIEAAAFVVPIAQSSAEAIEMRRQEAHGRYLSAARPGAYQREEKTSVTVGGRKINLKEDGGGWVAPGSQKVN